MRFPGYAIGNHGNDNWGGQSYRPTESSVHVEMDQGIHYYICVPAFVDHRLRSLLRDIVINLR